MLSSNRTAHSIQNKHAILEKHLPNFVNDQRKIVYEKNLSIHKSMRWLASETAFFHCWRRTNFNPSLLPRIMGVDGDQLIATTIDNPCAAICTAKFTDSSRGFFVLILYSSGSERTLLGYLSPNLEIVSSESKAGIWEAIITKSDSPGTGVISTGRFLIRRSTDDAFITYCPEFDRIELLSAEEANRKNPINGDWMKSIEWSVIDDKPVSDAQVEEILGLI